ncbi:MAG: hypothetical protein L6Q98_17640 [Anaerolineae bacterium]|nr:hypothetical protein [Anaerolineae bacterium]
MQLLQARFKPPNLSFPILIAAVNLRRVTHLLDGVEHVAQRLPGVSQRLFQRLDPLRAVFCTHIQRLGNRLGYRSQILPRQHLCHQHVDHRILDHLGARSLRRTLLFPRVRTDQIGISFSPARRRLALDMHEMLFALDGPAENQTAQQMWTSHAPRLKLSGCLVPSHPQRPLAHALLLFVEPLARDERRHEVRVDHPAILQCAGVDGIRKKRHVTLCIAIQPCRLMNLSM